MEVEASIDSSIAFTGDTLHARITIKPKNALHILSAVTSLQTTLHLGDLLQPEPFENLRSRGLIAGMEAPKPQKLWGIFGMGEKVLDYKLWGSPQQLLCADTKIAAYEQKEFESIFILPLNLPPSHSTKPLEVHHELVIEFQYLKEGVPTPQQLILPFKVYPREEIDYNLLQEINLDTSQLSGKQKIRDHLNTLLETRKLGSAGEQLGNIPEPLPPKLRFNLIKDEKKLAEINLLKSYIHAGDLLVGSVSLAPECFHMCAKLEMVEQIEPSIAVANSKHRKVISSQSYTVYGLDTAAIQLPTPAGLLPQTNLTQVKINYDLRMELTCIIDKTFNDEKYAAAESQVKTYTISTTVPITVAAPLAPPYQYRRLWSILS